jgi:carbamoyltransferase
MIEWGINALNHGSSLAVFKDGVFQQAILSTDNELPGDVIRTALDRGSPDRIYWYENPWLKKARQIRAKQYSTAFDLSNLPSRYLKRARLGYAPITYTQHHASHAAAGYYTSPFNHCAIVVIDAIGEFETATIWQGFGGEMKKLWSARYPHSLGLFYSAFTKFLGLTPLRDEHILQQMARQGDPTRFRSTIDLYVKPGIMNFDYNFHRGVRNWDCGNWTVQDQCDLAAAVQAKFEIQVATIMYQARELTGSNSLVYMGGCAMNSDANRVIQHKFDYRWSLPDPGDGSSSIGAVAYHRKQRIHQDWAPVKHLAINV